METSDDYNYLSKQVLDASITVHKAMEPGLLESIYEACLCKELKNRGIKFRQQVMLPLYYKGEKLEMEFRIDLLVDDLNIIEIKAVDMLLPVHTAQVLAYLKLADKKLGLLINFNTFVLKDGFKRIVNNL